MERGTLVVVGVAIALVATVFMLLDLGTTSPSPATPNAVDEPAAAGLPMPITEAPEALRARTLDRESAPVLMRGRLIDQHGAGIVGMRVELRRRYPPFQSFSVVTGLDGHILLTGDHVIAGDFDATIRGRGLLHASGAVPLPTDELVTIEVARLPAIRGFVRTAGGEPLPGVAIQSGHGSGVTASDGGFEVFEAPDDHKLSLTVGVPTWLRVIPSREYQGMELAGPFEFDSDPIELVVRPARHATIRVIEARSGAPVENFAVRTQPPGVLLGEQSGPRLRGHHPAGELTVDGLWDGVNLVRVIPGDPLLAASVIVEIDPQRSPLTVIRVERRRPLRVQVIWNDGQPAVGYRTDAITLRASTIPRYVRDPRETSLEMPNGVSSFVPSVVASGTTDARGFVDLGIPREFFRLGLRVHHPDYTKPHSDQMIGRVAPDRTIVKLRWRRTEEVTELEPQPAQPAAAEPTATIEGRVTIRGEPARGFVGLVRRNYQPFRRCELDADGRYRFEGLPRPSTYMLFLEPGFGRESGWWDPDLKRSVRRAGIHRADLKFTGRQAVFRVRLPDGSPVAGRRFDVGVGEVKQPVRSDENGEVLVEAVPNRGSLDIWWWSKEPIGSVELNTIRESYVVPVTAEPPPSRER